MSRFLPFDLKKVPIDICVHIYVFRVLSLSARLSLFDFASLDVFPGPSCLSSDVKARQCAYETLMELPPLLFPFAEASKLLKFFFCIALPREIDIIRIYIQ